MNPCDIFQIIPDLEISGSLSSFYLLIVSKAYPQSVRHLLMSFSFPHPHFFPILSMMHQMMDAPISTRIVAPTPHQKSGMYISITFFQYAYTVGYVPDSPHDQFSIAFYHHVVW